MTQTSVENRAAVQLRAGNAESAVCLKVETCHVRRGSEGGRTGHEGREKEMLRARCPAEAAVTLTRLVLKSEGRNLPQLMSRHTASVTLSTASGCRGSFDATDASEKIPIVRSVEPVASRVSSLLTATVMMLALCTA
jgi:hypothetical protein